MQSQIRSHMTACKGRSMHGDDHFETKPFTLTSLNSLGEVSKFCFVPSSHSSQPLDSLLHSSRALALAATVSQHSTSSSERTWWMATPWLVTCLPMSQ